MALHSTRIPLFATFEKTASILISSVSDENLGRWMGIRMHNPLPGNLHYPIHPELVLVAMKLSVFLVAGSLSVTALAQKVKVSE